MQPSETVHHHEEQNLVVAPEAIENAWFDAAKLGKRPSTIPPRPLEKVGEFLGDELADAWLR